MTKVYKLLNPSTGLHTDINDVETLKKEIARSAYEFFMIHTHNNPYNIAIKNPDGSETWHQSNGEVIPEDIVISILGLVENPPEV